MPHQHLSKLPAVLTRRVAKHCTGWFAHGKFALRTKVSDTDICPRCKSNIEDKHHVIRCPSRRAETRWKSLMLDLVEFFEGNHTPTNIASMIVDNLNAYRQDKLPVLPDQQPARSVVIRQCTLGWRQMMDGFLDDGWSMLFDTSYCPPKSVRYPLSGKRWVSSLIKKLMNTAWDMWEHRNEIKHENEKTANPETTQKLKEEIERQFLIGCEDLPNYMQDWFESLETTLDQSLDHQRHWLEGVAHERRLVLRDQAEDPTIQQMQNVLRRWLDQHQPVITRRRSMP